MRTSRQVAAIPQVHCIAPAEATTCRTNKRHSSQHCCVSPATEVDHDGGGGPCGDGRASGCCNSPHATPHTTCICPGTRQKRVKRASAQAPLTSSRTASGTLRQRLHCGVTWGSTTLTCGCTSSYIWLECRSTAREAECTSPWRSRRPSAPKKKQNSKTPIRQKRPIAVGSGTVLSACSRSVM